MRRTLLLLLTPCLIAADAFDVARDWDAVEALTSDAPADVRSFVQRRMECWHWAGEEPYDRARGRQINSAWRRLKCDRLDRDEARLLKRHAESPVIVQAIELARDLSD